MKPLRSAIVISCVGVPAFCVAPVASAQFEEVFVTARKREENVQNVRVAMTALIGVDGGASA
jgi:hypothetical protein